MKKDSAILYLLAAAAAYYAFIYIKNEKEKKVNAALQNDVKNSVESVVEYIKKIDQPILQTLIETPTTYQTYYGQINGSKYVKVPHQC
jgi:hypothetical protein